MHRSVMRRLSAGLRYLSTQTAKKTRVSGPGRLLLTRGLPSLTVAFGAHFSVPPLRPQSLAWHAADDASIITPFVGR